MGTKATYTYYQTQGLLTNSMGQTLNSPFGVTQGSCLGPLLCSLCYFIVSNYVILMTHSYIISVSRVAPFRRHGTQIQFTTSIVLLFDTAFLLQHKNLRVMIIQFRMLVWD